MSLNTEAHKSGGVQDYPEYLLQENQLATDENVGLFHAANKGNLAECEKLLKRGAKPNFFFRPDDQKNALHVAAEHGFVDIVKLLLRHGAEVNSIATTDQSSALTLAAHNDDPSVVKILLESGASIDHGNGYGNTALHEACRAGNAAVIQCLLQSGADVNAVNHKGSSPLHIYCYGDAEKRAAGKDKHTVDVCRVLIEAGAVVDAHDARGATPLLVSCASGRIDLIELLASFGADIHAKDGKGQDGRDIADFYGNEGVSKYLGTKGFK